MKRNREAASTLDLSNKKTVITWIWSEHNSVSSRISKERSSSKRNIRQPFPNEIQCSSCHTNNGWNPDVVLRFLIATYCFDDQRLQCTFSLPDTPFPHYLLSLAFLMIGVGLVMLRYFGKRLNKKMH